MHDGAPAHFSVNVRQSLYERFRDRWIRRGGPIPWPPHSPDLNPLDFYLWGDLKALVYETSVQDVESLCTHIMEGCETIQHSSGIHPIQVIRSEGKISNKKTVQCTKCPNQKCPDIIDLDIFVLENLHFGIFVLDIYGLDIFVLDIFALDICVWTFLLRTFSFGHYDCGSDKSVSPGCNVTAG